MPTASAKALTSTALAALLAGMAPLAAACPPEFNPCTDETEFVIPLATETLYVIVHFPQGQETGVDYKIYAESNGLPGVQRGGVSLDGAIDNCQSGAWNPDTFVSGMNHEDYSPDGFIAKVLRIKNTM